MEALDQKLKQKLDKTEYKFSTDSAVQTVKISQEFKTDFPDFVLAGPKKIKQFTTQAEIHWPGKIVGEVTFHHTRYPKLKMWDMDHYILLSMDGGTYKVWPANIKGCEYE